uniref:DUF5641 domain-containing protein n=1 Tax=Anopheles dirus TaxID=7168 RepID=A0A182NDR4_9DIPT
MDADGILRVKGRIDACSYATYDTKRPIILPKVGKVTDLIVDDYHRRYRHQNHQTIINEVRQKFDIPALRMACHRIINSRPLTDVPVDSEEEAPLTPNHFLLSSSSGVKPLVPFDDSPNPLQNNWKTSQLYANLFWRKWIRAYLPTLTRRTKWYQPRKPLQEGDVVLLVDENLPRGCWPKGQITQAIQSKDGAVRRVHVRLATGKICERPAVK